jgi:tRNA(Met) cytidine acetyltransferase
MGGELAGPGAPKRPQAVSEASPVGGTAALEGLTDALVAAARARNQRRALVLAGDRGWCRRTSEAILRKAGLEPILRVGAGAGAGADAISPRQAGAELGREWSAVVYDAHGGFDPTSFGALSGTLRGGGLLLLLTPPLADWPAFPDPERARIAVAPFGPEAVTGRFLRRLVQVIRERELPILTPERIPMAANRGPARSAESLSQAPADGCRTADQRRAVEAIIRAATGHRRRPVVLVSDRGRGKSSALGIAAARLLQQGLAHIVVTAPRLAAVEPVFTHARQRLPEAEAEVGRGHLRLGARALEFVSPDALTLAPRPANLLLVDEAAAIPAPILARLLGHYGRIVFATTVHGYEGTGRGFALRFRGVLDSVAPGWREVRLVAPVRWAAHDPVEGFVFRALLLDAEPAPAAALVDVGRRPWQIEEIDRAALADDEVTLAELFGLLILAHYRTTPLDLRYLLDGPNLTILLARHGAHVAGAALVAREGGFGPTTARALWLGRRRLRGNLIPQTLAQHLGLQAGARLRCDRVMRIAVHPAARRRGVGRALLGAVAARAERDGMDYLGASFGAASDVLQFWRATGHLPVRIGVRRETTSGAHSVVMLRAVSPAGQRLLTRARGRFLRQLPAMLAEPLRGLDPALGVELLAAQTAGSGADVTASLSEDDWRDLLAFAYGARGFDVCLGPLRQLAFLALSDPGCGTRLDARQRALLMAKVLQHRSWGEVTTELAMSGRGEALGELRAAVRPLVDHYAGRRIREAARGLAEDGP